jgi:hypothetical protein
MESKTLSTVELLKIGDNEWENLLKEINISTVSSWWDWEKP